MSVDADKPHKAILLINLEVHSVNDKGECEGRVLTRQELSEYGIKPKFTATINGFDKHNCLVKLKEIIDKLESK